MIGHITYLNVAADYGYLKDFQGKQYRFKLSRLPDKDQLTAGRCVRFEPQVEQTGYLAADVCLMAVNATSVDLQEVSNKGQAYIRVANIVIPLANVANYQMTSNATLIRNGYQTAARHLTIDLTDGRQLNFFNWDEVNIDDLWRRLQKYFIGHSVSR